MASERFSEFRKRIQSSDPNGSDVAPPAGKYFAVAVVAVAKEYGTASRLSIKWRVDVGPEAGSQAWSSSGYDPSSEDGVRFFFRTCDALRIDYDALDDIDPTDAHALVSAVAEQVKAKNPRAAVTCDTYTPKGKGPEDARIEVKYVNPLPKDAPEPQAAQASKGMAKVASAKPAAKKAAAAAPDGPAKPAF